MTMRENRMTTTKADRNAGAALVAAVENEDIHKRAALGKARAADAAHAKGAEMDAASLMQVQDEARVAVAELDIANAIHRGAERRRQEAEISVWFEQAE